MRALAAAAGLQPVKKEPDVDGSDFVIGYPGYLGRARSPLIEAQVKSWSRPKGSQTDWRFRGLTERQFNNLAGKFTLPRFLFLVIVPNDAAKYTDAGPDALRLNHAVYWASLRCLAPIDNPSKTRKKLVEVPKTNLLTVTSLLELLASVRAEE